MPGRILPGCLFFLLRGKVGLRLLRIAADLRLHGGKRGKFLLLAQGKMKIHPNLAAVKIAGKVQQPGFYGGVVAADRWTGANIRHGGVRCLLDPDFCRIDAVGQAANACRDGKIRRGDAQRVPQMLPGDDRAGEAVGVPQQAVGLFQLPGCE